MPISFTPIANEQHWAGCSWSIEDEDELAHLIARVALGQYRHILRVLAGTNCLAYAPAATALEGAKKLLKAMNPAEPWHRDGWLFQVMSWIASHLQEDGSLIAPPHMIHAHKGFDGLHVHIDKDTQRVVSVVICEEKATKNPRKMITGRVWPEFKSLQSGERDNELVAQVSSLINSHPDLDPDQAVQEILWNETRAYRIAITVDNDDSTEVGRKKLFEDYGEIISGDVSRRRAETLYLDDLRAWMNGMATKAIAAAEEMEAAHV